jgi:hypothetical protein
MAKGKLKVMHQGAKMADEFILEFKLEASHSNLGDVLLIEYLKAGLNQSLFKSIYWLPHMLETLQEWYKWAMKLDRQYHPEQAESKLFRHASSSSKSGKLSGKSAEKNPTPTLHIEQALPPAMAVTPECAPDAMDVDCAGRCPPIKCFNCAKIGHTARFCWEKRKIWEAHIE